MKTPLNIDDDLLARAKAQAAIKRKSLTRLIGEGHSRRSRKAGRDQRGERPGIPVFRGGAGLRVDWPGPARRRRASVGAEAADPVLVYGGSASLAQADHQLLSGQALGMAT
ncbi:MAG: hypothetical protein H7242_03600 [Microbacteriaceae bacterium]|nr:hypothetical protein [Burkholderiaceae bacterium]